LKNERTVLPLKAEINIARGMPDFAALDFGQEIIPFMKI
jgi:hypothetical protein